MNWLDLAIIGLLLLAAVHGIFRGAAVQVLTFGGMGAGLALGVILAPSAARLMDNPLLRPPVSLLVVFGLAGLMGGVGEWLGMKVRSTIRVLMLRPVDAGLGAGIAVVSTLLAVWLISGMLVSAPIPGNLRAVHDSKIVRTLKSVLPPAPAVFSRVGSLLTKAGFPPVFAEFEPSPQPSVPLPGGSDIQAAVEAADQSTVKILGSGCGGILFGSGFVAAPNLVVTNAHVIAGVDRPQVQDSTGRHSSVPLLFDPDLDLAILRVTGLAGPPLPIDTSTLPRGAVGAVLGYPGGGALQVSPAAVRGKLEAVGRDIYARSLTSRQIYQLDAKVRPGNSGGPFVGTGGQVAGVVFSVSVVDASIAYALTGDEVAKRLAAVRGRSAAVDTGPCA